MATFWNGPKTKSIAENTKHKETEFNIRQHRSILSDLLKDQTNGETIQAQREFANKCSDFLQAKTGKTCVGTIRWSANFCDATAGEYVLKVKVPSKEKASVKLVVDIQNCSCLADEESYNCMSGTFDALSLIDPPHASPSENHWTHLLLHWKKFTSSFRQNGFSNVKLKFCGLNGEQVVFKGNRVKSTILVQLNEKQREMVMFRVSEINKRTLANIILKLCGNEGAEQTTEQAGLRRLLQAFMTKLEADKVTSYTDVMLSLYGQGDSAFYISSGDKDKHRKVTGYVDSKGEFHIREKNTAKPNQCIIF